MMDWFDFSGFGSPLARFRRWLDGMPTRGFAELGFWSRLGRLTLVLLVTGLLCAPVIWLLAP
jgi:hypothetical protein